MNRRQFLAATAAAPFVLRTELVRAAADPLALVTADTNSSVVAVDPFRGRVLRRISTHADPRSIELVGETAVIAHTAVGAVTLLHGPSLEIRSVLHSFDEPRYTAGAPDHRHAFVTDSGRREVAVLDVSNPAHPRLAAKIRPPFLGHDVGFVPGGRQVWVTSGDRGALAVYNAGNGKVVRRLPAGAPPQHVTFVGGNAYVTSGNDGNLRVQSLRDGRILRRTEVPVGSYNVQQGWGRILTPSLDHGT